MAVIKFVLKQTTEPSTDNAKLKVTSRDTSFQASLEDDGKSLRCVANHTGLSRVLSRTVVIKVIGNNFISRSVQCCRAKQSNCILKFMLQL